MTRKTSTGIQPPDVIKSTAAPTTTSAIFVGVLNDELFQASQAFLQSRRTEP